MERIDGFEQLLFDLKNTSQSKSEQGTKFEQLMQCIV